MIHSHNKTNEMQ